MRILLTCAHAPQYIKEQCDDENYELTTVIEDFEFSQIPQLLSEYKDYYIHNDFIWTGDPSIIIEPCTDNIRRHYAVSTNYDTIDYCIKLYNFFIG